ncbi:OTU domain-containing protein 5 isoform X4 [Sesbania bispinosa]|nr:OTU domain-containing protein 5 isoform X4 [Sesbania bispinosa]
MTRVLVQRGSSGGSSSNPNPNRNNGSGSSSSSRAEPQVSVPPAPRDEESVEEVVGVVVGDEVLESGECNKARSEDPLLGGHHFEQHNDGSCDDEVGAVVESDVKEEVVVKGLSGLRERLASEIEGSSGDAVPHPGGGGGSCPPPPPVPPPKPSSVANLNSRRNTSGSSNSGCVGSSRRASAWPPVSARTSPAGSRPSSPRSHNESEGYNSADEQKPCFVSSYDDFVS